MPGISKTYLRDQFLKLKFNRQMDNLAPKLGSLRTKPLMLMCHDSEPKAGEFRIRSPL